MDCQHCGTALVTFAVPAAYRGTLPGDASAAGLCPTCLGLQPVDGPNESAADLATVSDAVPPDPDAAIPLALLVGLLENLALNRAKIAELIEAVEAAGVDPMLALDRLAADPAIDARIDLRGRRRQLEQLL
jgi:hypothetical protein